MGGDALYHVPIACPNVLDLLQEYVIVNPSQMIDNLANNFHGYAVLLRKIKQRVLIAQQRAIYAANEEMLRMYWDVGEMLQKSQDADGWGKKTLQRLSVDLKNEYSEIKGFSVRNMQYMIQFFNEYNQEHHLSLPIKHLYICVLRHIFL